MTFEELRYFLKYQMKMTFIYQPVVIRTLLKHQGQASVREIAKNALSFDEAQIDYYIRVIKRYPRQVLTQHGIIETQRNGLFRLTVPVDELTEEQTTELLGLCDEKIQIYLQSHKGVIGDHRYNPDSLSSGSVRYEVLKRAKGRCALCGASIAVTPIDVDHIVPRTKGGGNDISNLQALCDRCNRSKGNRDRTDFRDYGSESSLDSCIFCNLGDRVVKVYNTAQQIMDNYPVSTLHTLLIPKRHVGNAFELSSEEISDIFQLAKHVTAALERQDQAITGFNIGFNIGGSAGQTIEHAHLHIIPRRDGDVENPRGGIRNILPDETGYGRI